jgi:hypothetical protein
MNTRPATYLYACMPCTCAFERTYPTRDTMTETPAPPSPTDPAPPQPQPAPSPPPSPTQPQ